MASKIDANFERPSFQKTEFFQWKNNDFEGSGDRSWEQKSIKNRSKIEVQDGWPLGIDFLVDVDGFWEASWHPKSHKNRSQEASKKGCQKVGILDRIFGRLGGFQAGPGGGGRTHGPRRISGPQSNK